MRGRTAIALASTMDDAASVTAAGGTWTRKRLLEDATRISPACAATGTTWRPRGRRCSRLVVARLRGDVAGATRALESAIAAAEIAEMAAYREAARYALSTLMPAGDERDRARAQAETWLRGQGVVKIEAFVGVLCPGVIATRGD